jgi:predicted nuclease of predicted toxin-antitoxin system
MRFLIDANLPHMISFWKGEQYTYVSKLDPSMTDTKVWSLAKSNQMTIVNKDSDFVDRIMNSEPPPKVIHIKLGNIRNQDFHSYMKSNWTTIVELIENHKLVIANRDEIVSI